MRAFRNSGNHRTAMPKLAGWCDEASYVHWEQADDLAPDLKTAHDRLVAEGVVSQVNHPSSVNATRAFPAPGAGYINYLRVPSLGMAKEQSKPL